ncbi:hypothetical protein MSAN_00261200 [Mycena sanguinolenta]|uniref:Uncharacterized protein n=1 Tax=Mycena sanguinolenta TaxID=230812 RepID=A0A8H6ZJ73_9AGAR|nr:hypothetical protein MSAN_00261200 [Mycena sanguinolenta]
MFRTNSEAQHEILFLPQPWDIDVAEKMYAPSTCALSVEYRGCSSEMIGHYLNLPRNRAAHDAHLHPQNGGLDSSDEWTEFSAAGSPDYFENDMQRSQSEQEPVRSA